MIKPPAAPRRPAALVAAIVAVVGLGLFAHPRGFLPRAVSHTKPSIRFADAGRSVGLAGRSSRTWGVSWIDLERDGDSDLLVGHHWGPARLYEQDAGAFRVLRGIDALDTAPYDRHSCAWGEANGDGRLDLYCAAGAGRGHGRGPKQLLINTGASLDDRAHQLGVRLPIARGRSVNWLDYDLDGDLDIFVGNELRPGFANVMFTNDDGVFERKPVGLEHELGTSGSYWSDWDADGDPDLLLTQHQKPLVAYENEGGTFRVVVLGPEFGRRWRSASWADFDGDGWEDLSLVGKSRAVVLKNDGRRFTKAARIDLKEGRTSAWADLDNDMDLDLVIAQGAVGDHTRPVDGEINQPDFIWLNNLGVFARVDAPGVAGPTEGNADAVAIGDYDRDGRLDIVTTNGMMHWRGPVSLLANRSKAGNWAALDVEGPPWNAAAFGIRLVVRAGNTVYRRLITDGVGLHSQSEPGWIHLGLGSAEAAGVRIEWPDGSRDCIRLRVGETLHVAYGSDPCPSAEPRLER